MILILNRFTQHCAAGTITYVYLTTWLPLCTWTAAVNRYVAGPRPDPCITLAWIFTHRYFSGVLRAVRTVAEEVFYPVECIVRQLLLRHLIHQCGMPHGVERFWEVQGKNSDERICWLVIMWYSYGIKISEVGLRYFISSQSTRVTDRRTGLLRSLTPR